LDVHSSRYPDVIHSGRGFPRSLWIVPLVAALLFGARSLVSAGNGLEARYYTGVAPAGTPARTTVDRAPSTAQIRQRWGSAPPDRFSVIWSGFVTVGARGTYRFATASSGGSQLFIDDALVVDNSGVHSLQTRAGQIRLTSGPHRIRLLFVKDGGDDALDVSWARDGRAPEPIPGWLLSTRPARLPLAWLGRVLDFAIALLIVPAALVLLWAAVLWLRRVSAPPAVVRWGERVAGIAAVILPVFFVAHALTFWGHGVIDEEATTFVINYLSNRPFLQAILDPQLNDWGSFQARELAYVFDRMDGRLFARLLVDHHVLLFVPLSSMLCLPAICGVYLLGARRVLRLEWTTALLLLTLFLSCIVTQASTPILYRSSKMLLSVAAIGFLFLLTRVLEPERRRVGTTPATALFVVGVVMSMCDRQGYAYLLSATTVIAALWVRQRWIRPPGDSSPERLFGPVALIGTAATIAAVLYNNVVAPNAILRANGYWPDMSYEDIPFERFNAALAGSALRMFRDEVSYFFGNLPIAVVGALGLLLWIAVAVRAPRRTHPGLLARLTSTGVVVTAAFASVLLVLIAVMGMRHPPVFRIVDHAFWYYTLSMQAVLLFAVSLALAQLRRQAPADPAPFAIHVLLLAMIAANVAHYPAQRKLLAESGEWFGKQLAFAQLYAASFEDDEAGESELVNPLPSWMHTRPDGVEVHLPPHAYGLLDAVRAGYATLEKRSPLIDAGGPYWRELRNFLDGSGSPLGEPGNVAHALAALQSVGVRRVVVHRRNYERPAEADAVIAWAQSAHDLVRSLSVRDDAATIELAETRSDWRRASDNDRLVPRSAMRVTGSGHSEALTLVNDGRIDTEWNSTTAQDGREWIRLDLDRPRSITALRLLVTDQALERYPRELTIESTGPSGPRTLFTGSTLPALFHGLLTRPVDAPIELLFPRNASSALTIRQTGRSPSWSWAVRELQLLQSPKDQADVPTS
jgi:hypothetical protein